MCLKPQDVINEKLNRIIAFLLFGFSLTIYVLTMARSLSFWDCGEYITCSSILGVPHPPGNPFYILLGRFFTALTGHGISHALVVNFMSAFFSSLAVMFTYLITVKLISMWQRREEAQFAYITGIIAALLTAFSFSFWHNAIEAEVYGGLAFTINLIIYLTLLYTQKSNDLSHQNYLILIIYIFFLGFGIHQTVLQIAPAVLFIILYPQILEAYRETGKFWLRTWIYLFGLIIIYFIFNGIGKSISVPDLSKMAFGLGIGIIIIFHTYKKVSIEAWLIAFLLVIIAFSPHIFLLVRSAHRPFINEGFPHNLELFKNYVLRTQYGTTNFTERNADFWNQFNHSFLRYFSWQFFHFDNIKNAIAIPIGFLHTLFPAVKAFHLPNNYLTVVPSGFLKTLFQALVAFLGFYGMYYTFKKNKHAFGYMIALFLMASLAMIFVMNQKYNEVRDRDYFFVTAYNLWAIWMALGCLGLIRLVFSRMKVLGYVVLIIALLLPVINLAAQYWEHDRHKEFIALDYGLNILNSLEENAIVFTNGDNDTFPVWYAQAVYDPYAIEKVWEARDVSPTPLTQKRIASAMDFKNSTLTGIRKDVSVANLSLLNTPWYIKQLRDKEGILFNLKDAHIEGCQTEPRSSLYPRRLDKDTRVKIKGNDVVDDFEIILKEGEALYTNDLAVIQIVKDNYGKRPIYFAVTVADVPGFKNNLRNEGMVDRLVSTRGGDQYDIERLTANTDSVYSYRTIFDDSVYKDPNMLRLLNNYGAAYMRASSYYREESDYDKAINYMESSLGFIQERYRFYRTLSQLYLLSGEQYLNLSEKTAADSSEEMVDAAFIRLENAVYYNRSSEDLIIGLYSIAKEYRVYDRIITLFNKIKFDPNSGQDPEVIDGLIQKLNDLKAE
ncbi:MAG: DUF2723 domain-containing protein [Candidatus Cloacimonetes bacterium]|nr:DUF2723 domain-containing protein [Candidatus Cloacimonadota bacterium]